DFNGDKSPDVIVILGQELRILLGNGDGSFQPAREIAATNSNPFLVIGDANGDGKLDLLVNGFIPKDPNCTDFCEQPDLINIYYGNGDGTFSAGGATVLSLFGGAGGRFVAADFNDDGKLDLFIPGRILLGGASGGFQSIPSEFLTFPPVLAADLNADKLPDLIGIDNANNAVLIQLNLSPTAGADIAVQNATAESLSPPIGAVVGEQTSYVLNFYNEGPQDASDVVVTETLAVGMQFVSASLDNCSGTSVVTCHLGPMVEPSLATINITVVPTAAGTLTDSTNISATPTDLNPANDTASITFSAALPVALSMTASASESVAAVGDQIKFMAAVSNAGPGTVTNLAVQDTITEMFPVSSLTISQGSCVLDTSFWQINCAIGTLAPGTTVNIEFIVTPNAPTPAFNDIFTATSDQASILDNGTNPVVSITVNAKPDFTITPASASLTMQAGASASDVLSIAAQSGFAGSVQLTCSVAGGSPAPSCAISPQSVTPGNSATLTVNAAGLSAWAWPRIEQTPTLLAAGLSFAISLALIGCIWAIACDKKRGWLNALCVVALGATTLLGACGGGSTASSPPPAAQTFTVTVTATSGGIQHSTSIDVTVE
ncbi:MAG: FG-GAP-like repeat-containing protein, partial [Candidatus Acidiferrales bacterium]